ncbi:GNAT family N-acetyltransferase [Flavobacterium terrigena]|uniref:Protein N-acetyltransferase, RimJ/RimL family n=1 Tax=Flavobacterium terrigena TaxID=402734 RepID=A0A1H6XKY5_9FLAO|nr:GNAT family N-acetyltransferase [Flavobacterium terrigena]SEJ29751.1 Protein N-acetyltransferase, RimJ/RimL family [Flavobacterium terrigena]
MKYTLEGQETERLKFRLLNIEDFDIWIELFEDIEICEFLGVDKIKTPEERCQFWFDITFDRYENNLGGANIIIDKTTNEIVGQSGLIVREIEEKQEIEIAYSILPKYRQKGYASEATKKCKDFAFENDFSKSLISIINTKNSNSEKVAENNGMTIDKTITFKDMLVNIYRINSVKWKLENNKI